VAPSTLKCEGLAVRRLLASVEGAARVAPARAVGPGASATALCDEVLPADGLQAPHAAQAASGLERPGEVPRFNGARGVLAQRLVPFGQRSVAPFGASATTTAPTTRTYT
jgi:hypothetical protein